MFIHYSAGIQERDKQKMQSCLKTGITMIAVPYWWDGSLSSLATTIHYMRPDISIPNSLLSSPIPMDKPEHRVMDSCKRNNTCNCSLVTYKPKRASDVPAKSNLIGWYIVKLDVTLSGGWLKSSVEYEYYGMDLR